MSDVCSIAAGAGDLYYIKHGSDSFTIIDCFLSEDNQETIVDHLISESKTKGIHRFISTHPDEDHFGGITYLNRRMPIVNFYCVKNETTKPEETDDFLTYCSLRDSNKAFYIESGSKRKWLNQNDEARGGAGIHIHWPKVNNKFYVEALKKAKEGESPNNISAVVSYNLNKGPSFLWMGDLETEFLENIKNDISLPESTVLFAPHHGRNSGKVPKELLEAINPKIVVIGEADSKYLNYYQGYNTITQNSAGTILFVCEQGKLHTFVSNSEYEVDFLNNENRTDYNFYLGSMDV